MSATLDGEALARLMGAARIVRAPGRMFEVETYYVAPPPGAAPQALAQRVVGRIAAAVESHEGDVLAFLPGAGEIRRVVEALSERLPADRCVVLPLYGDLPSAAQDAVLRPDPRGRRKVVVATNLAETSLTIDGVRIVVDSGQERRNRFDPATGMNRLETVRISRASADQRRGRAGRTAPGVCYRLWNESTHAALLPQAPAEILEADLAPLALELACWGADDPAALAWLDPPPAASLAQARELLTRLEALDARGRATPLGREMAALGVHPRLAHMILRGQALGLGDLACAVAAVLSERDPLRGAAGPADPDLRSRVDALRGRGLPPGTTADRGALARIGRVVEQLERRIGRRAPTGGAAAAAPDESDAVGLLLAFAYPDRIGRSRGEGGRYVLSGGRGAALPGPSALARSEYLAVAALDAGEREARIQLAAPLSLVLLLRHFGSLVEETTRVEWDPRSETVAARRIRRLGQLVLEDEPLRDAGERAAAAMLDGIRALGLRCLPWTRELEQWRARVAFARAQDPRGAAAWPDVSDAALLEGLESWLAPWLERITRRDQLVRVDLRRRAARTARLERAASARRARAHPPRRAERIAHRDRLLGRRADALRTPAGSVRTRRVAARRRGTRAGDARTAVARAPAGAGDARPRELLVARLPRGAQGTEGPLPEALLARGPARGRGDATRASARRVKLTRRAAPRRDRAARR